MTHVVRLHHLNRLPHFSIVKKGLILIIHQVQCIIQREPVQVSFLKILLLIYLEQVGLNPQEHISRHRHYYH